MRLRRMSLLNRAYFLCESRREMQCRRRTEKIDNENERKREVGIDRKRERERKATKDQEQRADSLENRVEEFFPASMDVLSQSRLASYASKNLFTTTISLSSRFFFVVRSSKQQKCRELLTRIVADSPRYLNTSHEGILSIYFVRAMYKTLNISFALVVMKYDRKIILVKFEINLKRYIHIEITTFLLQSMLINVKNGAAVYRGSLI